MFRVLFTSLFCAGGLTTASPITAQQPTPGQAYQLACAEVGELARGLDQVVNIKQILNNNRDIWQDSRGCNWRDMLEMYDDSIIFLGWYLTSPKERNGQRFWARIYAVEFQAIRPGIEVLPGVTIEEETRLRVNFGFFPADGFRLRRGCEEEWVSWPEDYKRIRLYGSDRQGGIPYCHDIDPVGEGFRESPLRRW